MSETILNRKELAEKLGVHKQSITNWIKDGLPIHDKGMNGQHNTFNLADVMAWIHEKGKQIPTNTNSESEITSKTHDDMSLEDYKKLAMKIDTEAKQFRFDIVKGKYLNRKLVDSMVTDAVAFFKNHITGIPNKLDVDESVRAMVKKEIEAVLHKMADEIEGVAEKIEAKQKRRFADSLEREKLDSTKT